MSKVFGYTKKGGKDWFASDAYSDKEIEAIKDPEGGSETSLPTAIPSPFARIDLVKIAFNNIIKSPNLKFFEKNGNVIASKEDEKLVSDCLDLAEMLFNYDSIKDKVKIIAWDREVEINTLKVGTTKQRMFAETLSLYLEQDKESYNFDLLRRLFLIEYNHKIIGCTSPATLFFATANNLSFVQIKLTMNDILFDDKYTPLYDRDIEFQKFFYHLFKANPLLTQRMKGFAEYLDRNLKILNQTNPSLYSEINRIKATDYVNLYSELNTGTKNSEIEVIGIGLRKRKTEDVIDFISKNSDFRIASTKYHGERKPLALQNEFPKEWLYTKDKWHKFKVPFADPLSIDKRRLPEINFAYPYLTVSDFLEPYLIRLVYPINKRKFFDGNLTAEVGDESKGYILPLKAQFFDFFNSDDLSNPVSGKPKIEMIQGVSNSVHVVLSIPVTKYGEYISFERIYYQTSENQKSKLEEIEQTNKGVIFEQEFGLSIFPFVKTNNPNIRADYRVQVIDRNISKGYKSIDYNLRFYSNEANIENNIIKKVRSNKHAGDDATSQYYILHNEFDYIQIKDQNNTGVAGIIIPYWNLYTPGNRAFSFALDFGTTNTHIEYKADGKVQPFDITEEDMQIATLFDLDRTSEDFAGTGAIAIRELINYEFVPSIIGTGNFKFPTRTVSGESKSLDISTETFTLADFNIPFTYEKSRDLVNEIKSNLKWAKKEPGNQKRVRAFLEKLIMLMRNKVLLKNGNLSLTTLVWFYPSSMKASRRNDMENVINDIFNSYFMPQEQPIGITESLAPFFYYKSTGQLPGGTFSPVVSIDIGGGTSDIVIFKNNEPIKLTSFKFAANSIFGDAFYEYGADANGIIKKYVPHYEHLLIANKQYDLSALLSSINDKKKSDDINAFLFSLENNSKIQDRKLFSYNNLLANDEDLKIIFLYFYTSIIYHITDLLKFNSIDLPQHIVFSGTGSKILSIISSSQKTLTDFTKIIIEKRFGKSFGSDGLTIKTEKNIPKEVTCKGGLMSNPADLAISIKNISTKLTCLEDKGINKLSISDINDKTKEGIIHYIREFNSSFLTLNSIFSFNEYFNVSQKSLELFKQEVNKHVRDYLEEGLEYNKKLDEVPTDDKEIEETLFFYPLIGTINNLSGQLASLSPVNN